MTDTRSVLERIQDPEVWVERCVNDLYFLCRNVMQTLEDPTPGYKDLYKPTHQHVCRFVEENAKEGHKILVLLPRSWIKSYMITIGWTAQRLMKNWMTGTREHILISNATIGNAMNFLEKIKYNFAYNDFLRGLMRKYIPEDLEKGAERWTMDEIQLHGNKIETGSVEGNLVSRHYKIQINDDLVNKENSLTREQIDKVIDWWMLSQSLLLPTGIEIIIGTRWDFDDLYGEFIRNNITEDRDYYYGKPFVELHKGNFHLLQYDCWSDPIKETGSTFPIMFPEEKLKELQEFQRDRFGGQYRNDPLAKGKNPFKREWVRYWDHGDVPNIVNTIMTVDPSGKAKKESASDFSGIVVMDAAVDKKGYIRFGKRKLVTDMKLAEWIVEVALIYTPAMIGIEDSKHRTVSELLELMIPQMIKYKKIPPEYISYVRTLPYILIELQPMGRPKPVRIENITGSVESGRFLFPRHGAEELEDEMIRYPSAKNDDIVDAFAYLLDLLTFPKPSDPPKYLVVPKDLKISREDREEEEWENVREEMYHEQRMGWEGMDDLY